MPALTPNRPIRDLAAFVVAGLLAFGVVRACAGDDNEPDSVTDSSQNSEQDDQPTDG